MNGAGTGWSATIPSADANTLTDGASALQVTAQVTDQYGNQSALASQSFTVDIDANELVTVGLTGLTGGYALEDQKITATPTDSDNDVPASGVSYAWQVSHNGGSTWSTVGSNSHNYTPSEADEGGLLKVVASFTDAAGNSESGSTTVGVLPLLTIANTSLSVTPNGSVALGIGVVQEPTPDDTISVTISFNHSGSHDPAITAGDHATGNPTTSHDVTTYTFSASDVSGGLTFTNHGDLADTLTVTELLDGSTATTQTITVTDPPISDASFTIHSGETVDLVDPSAAAVTFANDSGHSGTLVLEQSASFTGQIVGFTGDGTAANSDIIDLRGVDFAKAQESYAQANGSDSGTLTVSDGQTAVQINFQGTYVAGNFVLADDGNGGTLVIDPPVADKASTSGGTQAHVDLLHLSDNFDFADGINHAGLSPTLAPHFGGTLTDASASAAHLQLDSFDFGWTTPVNFQPGDLGKLAALPDLPTLNDWQQLLVHAATGAQDAPSAAVAGMVSSEAPAGHPNSHFILHA